MTLKHKIHTPFLKNTFLLITIFTSLGAGKIFAQSPPVGQANLENSDKVFANINTADNEFSPVISPDGSYMLFNSKRGGRYQDIHISKKEDGIWGTPSPMRILNSPYNDESPFISADGKTIIFSSDRDGSREMPKNSRGQIKVSYDLYWSHLIDGKWSRPVPVPGVNTPHHEKAPSLSLDGATLYFSRWQWGKLDSAQIFEAKKSQNGFETPKPLDAVNTGNLEVILIPDERGMGFFFSAAREDSLGGFDIYYISYYEGEFGAAVNLGKPFNSEANEAYFSIHKGVIYFCSDRKGPKHKFDIMASELPKESVVQFKTVNEASDPLGDVSIIITRPDEESAKEKKSNELGRSDFLLNNQGGSYNVFIEKPGYIPVYKNYPAGEIFKGLHTITLKKLKEKLDLDFRELYFDTASAKIQERSLPFLEALAAYLAANPEIKILIVGHTDARGSAQYNLKLSVERAESVKKFLVERGVKPQNLQTKGAGESQAGGESASQQAKERKTEFILLNIKKNPPE